MLFLTFCFHEIKILKIYDILTFCLFVFLDLFNIIIFHFTIQLKILKTRFYCFHFMLFLVFIFIENNIKNPTKTHFQ